MGSVTEIQNLLLVEQATLDDVVNRANALVADMYLVVDLAIVFITINRYFASKLLETKHRLALYTHLNDTNRTKLILAPSICGSNYTN